MNIFYEDSDDDWFCKSIRRYGKLVMFEVENTVQEMELCSASTICALCISKSGQSILSLLSLPSKLMSKSDEGLTNDNDLKIKSGAFLDYHTSQIVTLVDHQKVLLSQENVFGLSVYSLKSDCSDQIEKSGSVDFPLSSPRLCLDSNNLAAATNSSEDSFVLDLTTGNVTYRVEGHRFKANDGVLPIFVTKNILGLCHESSGAINFYDTRRKTSIGAFENGQKTDGSWTVRSRRPHPGDEASTIGLLSDRGSLRLIDPRLLTGPPSMSVGLGVSRSRPAPNAFRHSLHFCPSDPRFLSVSGLDGDVHIFEIGAAGARLIFSHDGHRHAETAPRDTLTSSHFWYEPGGADVLISSALNASIDCWQFNPIS